MADKAETAETEAGAADVPAADADDGDSAIAGAAGKAVTGIRFFCRFPSKKLQSMLWLFATFRPSMSSSLRLPSSECRSACVNLGLAGRSIAGERNGGDSEAEGGVALTHRTDRDHRCHRRYGNRHTIVIGHAVAGDRRNAIAGDENSNQV